jgi:sensor histidine kinase YesM
MNPHFYFNTLNSINSYVLNNDAKSANKYLTTFARLMREILENSQREFITIAEEKEVLNNYLSLQQLRYQNAFEYKITAEDRVKQHIIPPMLVQPFVENATEYAFVNMPFKGIIHVTFELINNNIVCTITDNGIGIRNSQKLQAGRKRKSAAISNISQRIDMINKTFKVSIQLLITALDSSDEDFPGTQIRLIIPIIKNR